MTTNRTPATSAASTATTSAASLLRHLLPALRALAHALDGGSADDEPLRDGAPRDGAPHRGDGPERPSGERAEP